MDLDTGKVVWGEAVPDFQSGGLGSAPNGAYLLLRDSSLKPFTYRLEPIDAKVGDDMHNLSERNLFRLHTAGTVSNGCITVCQNGAALEQLISNTRVYRSVDTESYRRFTPFGIGRYRSLDVVGTVVVTGSKQ
jgi:hypothetical protein